jgi:hypothetical protein
MENQEHIHKMVEESEQISYLIRTLKLWMCEIQNALAHPVTTQQNVRYLWDTSDKFYIKKLYIMWCHRNILAHSC